jgi:transitional endoplasmic reticulum ATPase
LALSLAQHLNTAGDQVDTGASFYVDDGGYFTIHHHLLADTNLVNSKLHDSFPTLQHSCNNKHNKMTGSSFTVYSHADETAREYYHHSSAQRVNTDIVVAEALRKQYPNLNLIVVPPYGLSLLNYASAGFATATPLEDNTPYGKALAWKSFVPPARRLDNSPGVMTERVIFAKYMYEWKGHEFILYIISGRDGSGPYPDLTNHYILTSQTHKVDELIKEATIWGAELHNQVWVFDQGYWQKSSELYDAVQKSNWEDVILQEDMKKAIISDVESFFDGKNTYQDLRVPWVCPLVHPHVKHH